MTSQEKRYYPKDTDGSNGRFFGLGWYDGQTNLAVCDVFTLSIWSSHGQLDWDGHIT
ncbi:MAG: hypothetical protein ACFFCW_26415 [Candidatus Hodarchaeota archaeon]